MSRWRPAKPASTAIITVAGHAALKSELDDLWHHRRPQVVAALAAAAAEGDRSENAEYTWRKKQLGEIDRRVHYLSKRLSEVRVVDTQPHDLSRIYFGAWFELEDEDGYRRRYRIVGPDETDAPRGWISVDSPLARAALGCRLGAEFVADLPDEKIRFAVTSINYDRPIEDTQSTR
ncbi:MAG: transcription elongation factor GreB [Rhodanobacteraceae bacterium]